MGFEATLLSIPRRRVLIARPNARQYGHLGLEMLMALAEARRAAANVYFVRSRDVPGPGLFELDSREVRVLRLSRAIGKAAAAHLMIGAWRSRSSEWRRQWVDGVRSELIHEFTHHAHKKHVPKDVRYQLRQWRRHLQEGRDALRRPSEAPRSYFQRRLLREPVETHLRPEAEEEARRSARAHGIPDDAPIVAIHARESGYKRGREMQDAKPETGRDDGARNARIETYFEACDFLVNLGYTIVRLGDPSMTPVVRPGIIDIATSPARSNLLEVFLLLRSEFLIAGESGLLGVSYLTNTPLLTVNATEPISAYPIRPDGLFVTKQVIDKESGRRLRQEDFLTETYQNALRSTRRYFYIDNTAAEVAAAAREMRQWVHGERSESPGQRDYHDRIMAAAADLQTRMSYIRKWGLDDGFLGDGRIANVALERVS